MDLSAEGNIAHASILWLRVEEMMELLVVGSFFGMSCGIGACVRAFRRFLRCAILRDEDGLRLTCILSAKRCDGLIGFAIGH